MEIYANFFPAMIFISVLLSLMDFSDIVILCSRPNTCVVVANKLSVF